MSADHWVPWEDAGMLADSSDHLDELLGDLRAAHVEGEPWTTAEIAGYLISKSDSMLAEDDDPEDGALTLIDIVSIFAATAIQRLITGEL